MCSCITVFCSQLPWPNYLWSWTWWDACGPLPPTYYTLPHTATPAPATRPQVLLLDEITVDLDVVGRLRLLDFFRQESEQRGATILYATHIFDGLEGWVTHVAYMEAGAIKRGGPVGQLAEVAATSAGAEGGQQGQEGQEGQGGSRRKLLHVVEEWLRAERAAAKKAAAEAPAPSLEAAVRPQRTPFMPSKHLAFFR